jgi:hypothetical protein
MQLNNYNINNCSYIGCHEKAEWKPSVIVKTPENDKSFSLDFPWPVCNNHKQVIKLNDIIGGTVLDTIKKMFSEKFIYPPKKENMKLHWEKSIIPVFVSNKQIANIPIIR